MKTHSGDSNFIDTLNEDLASPMESHTGWAPYGYRPSISAGAAFGALFGILTLFHFYRIIRYRGWHFIPFAVGALMESIAYISRALWPSGQLFFTLQALLTIVAPLFICISLYVHLARLSVALRCQQLLPIQPKLLPIVFITATISCFFIMIAGVGILVSAVYAGNNTQALTGQGVVIGGVVMQVVIFLTFIVIAAVFHKRLSKASIPGYNRDAAKGRLFLGLLYFSGVCILIRNSFRVAAEVSIAGGPIHTQEGFMYGFDGTMMLLVVLGYAVMNPLGGDLWEGVSVRKAPRTGDIELRNSEYKNLNREG